VSITINNGTTPGFESFRAFAHTLGRDDKLIIREWTSWSQCERDAAEFGALCSYHYHPGAVLPDDSPGFNAFAAFNFRAYGQPLEESAKHWNAFDPLMRAACEASAAAGRRLLVALRGM